MFETHLLKNYDSHIEMMMFHSRRGIDCGEWGSDINHEFIVEPSVIQIVTNGSNEHSQTLKLFSCVVYQSTPNVSYKKYTKYTTYLQRLENSRRGLDDTVNGISHVKTMRPIVVSHAPIVFLDGD